jgi:hypothetical protein
MLYYPRHLSGGSEENHEKPQSGSLIPSRDFNPGPPEYKTGALSEYNSLIFLPLFTSLTIRGDL